MVGQHERPPIRRGYTYLDSETPSPFTCEVGASQLLLRVAFHASSTWKRIHAPGFHFQWVSLYRWGKGRPIIMRSQDTAASQWSGRDEKAHPLPLPLPPHSHGTFWAIMFRSQRISTKWNPFSGWDLPALIIPSFNPSSWGQSGMCEGSSNWSQGEDLAERKKCFAHVHITSKWNIWSVLVEDFIWEVIQLMPLCNLNKNFKQGLKDTHVVWGFLVLCWTSSLAEKE